MTASAEILALGVPTAAPNLGTESNPEIGSAAPVLITLQEVAFSTAAAMPVRATRLRRWAGAPSVLLVAMRGMLRASTSDIHAPRGDVPRRYSYLEYGCMSREMDRL